MYGSMGVWENVSNRTPTPAHSHTPTRLFFSGTLLAVPRSTILPASGFVLDCPLAAANRGGTCKKVTKVPSMRNIFARLAWLCAVALLAAGCQRNFVYLN